MIGGVDVEQLPNDHIDALALLRQNLKDIWCSDFESSTYLLRWLRAKKYDVKAAENMLRANTAWRIENGMDTILDDYVAPDVLRKFGPGGFCGHDKHGCPLYVYPIGMCDVKGLLRSATRQQMVRHAMYQLEYVMKVLCPRRSIEEDRTISYMVLIFDLECVGPQHMWKPFVDLTREILVQAEINYPETMRKAFMINVPLLFPLIYNVMKHCLREDTIKKVEIVGKDYKPLLLATFDRCHLPAKYGGSLTDSNGDPACREFICYGGIIPDMFYCREHDMGDIKELTINSRSYVIMKYLIDSPNTKLKCEYCTDDYDIGFGVSYIAKEKTEELPLVSVGRVDSHIEKQVITVPCEHIGTYIIKFDNSYSWFREKKVRFAVYTSTNGANMMLLGEESIKEETLSPI